MARLGTASAALGIGLGLGCPWAQFAFVRTRTPGAFPIRQTLVSNEDVADLDVCCIQEGLVWKVRCHLS